MIPQGPARGGEQRPRTLVHAAGTAEKLDASPITPPSPTAGIKRTNSMKFVDHADVDRDADRTVADAHHHRLERTGGDDSEEAVVCTRDNFGTAHGNRYDEECPVMVSILKEDGTSVNYRYGESEEMILDLFGEDSLEYEYFQHVKDVGYRGQNKLKRPEGIPITCIAGTGVKTASTLVYRADESTEIQRQVMSNSRRVNPFDLANLHNEDDDLFRISRHGLDNKNLKYLYTDGDGTVVTHSAMRLCDEHPGANTKKIEVAGNPGLHRDILDFETVKKEILAAATARTFTDVARAKIESADQDRSPVPGDLLPRGTHFG